MGDPTNRRRKRIKTTRASSTAADLAVSLPPEVIGEILIRLPVRSILRFKSVCKSWYAQFSDPMFVERHMKASKEDKDYANHRLAISSNYSTVVKSYSVASVLHEEFSKSESLDYPWRFSNAQVWIVGSVNGLILIILDRIGLFLWNPAIRESHKLPQNSFEYGSDQHTAYGFGFDETSSDYKVMLIKTDPRGVTCHSKSEVEIYGLKSNSWSKVQNFPECYLLGHSGKFVSGAFHWPARFGSGLNKNWAILAFNLSEETFSEISHPFLGDQTEGKTSRTNLGGRYLNSVIGVLDGCLCLLPKFDGINVEVWVMKEYGKTESWSKMFSVAFSYDPNSFMSSTPVLVSRKTKVLLMFGLTLVLYDLKRDTVSFPIIQDFHRRYPEVITYIETLVSPLQQQ